MHEDMESLLAAHAAAFERYFELLVEWNERVNLTSITDKPDVYDKHFVDSLLVLGSGEWREIAARGGSVIDIGTGAGFPGLPLAICCREVQFVLCDSLHKRVRFVQLVADELGLANVQAVHGRAEDLARLAGYRNGFDGAVSRAVARLNVLAELMLPFLRVDGFAFAYKGPGVEDELADGTRAADRLGARLVRVDAHELPRGKGQRAIVVFQQLQTTPKAYPRKAGTPQKNPL